MLILNSKIQIQVSRERPHTCPFPTRRNCCHLSSLSNISAADSLLLMPAATVSGIAYKVNITTTSKMCTLSYVPDYEYCLSELFLLMTVRYNAVIALYVQYAYMIHVNHFGPIFDLGSQLQYFAFHFTVLFLQFWTCSC